MNIDCCGNGRSHIKFTNVGKYSIGTKVRHKDKFNNPQEKEWYKKEYFIAKYNQFGTVYLTSLDGFPLWNHNGGIGVDNLVKVEEKQMIERNKEYDLKVTGEQLAWLYFVTTRSCNEFGLNYKMEEQYSPNLFKGYPQSKTNGIGWDNIYRDEVNAWLNNLFKAPETEKEKNLRELKEKHEELGEAIKKLEQSN